MIKLRNKVKTNHETKIMLMLFKHLTEKSTNNTNRRSLKDIEYMIQKVVKKIHELKDKLIKTSQDPQKVEEDVQVNDEDNN